MQVYVGEADAVPEDLEWADELRRYEDEKRHGSPYKDGQVGRPSIVTHQSRARDHGGTPRRRRDDLRRGGNNLFDVLHL